LRGSHIHPDNSVNLGALVRQVAEPPPGRHHAGAQAGKRRGEGVRTVYRVDIGESRAQGGTGLRLALVNHILHHHRGRLVIESTPGAGATFAVRLPLLKTPGVDQ
jgi:hypothetical protein